MTLTIGRGRGYVPAELNRGPQHTIGVIPIDSIFSPVRRVSYAGRVRARRSAHRLRQADARHHDRRLRRSEGRARRGGRDPHPPARDLHRHREDRGLRRVGGGVADGGGARDALAHGMENFPIEELELGVRSYNCLKRVGIETIGDLVMKTENELAAIPNFGKKSIEEVKETLQQHGLNLRGDNGGASVAVWRLSDAPRAAGKKLGRDSSHRKALYANLACSLIEHGRIRTTEAKAKAVKPYAEKMITLGRRGDLHARRQALAELRSQESRAPALLRDRAAHGRPARRLHADREDRPAPGRRRRDGLPRARRLRAVVWRSAASARADSRARAETAEAGRVRGRQQAAVASSSNRRGAEQASRARR